MIKIALRHPSGLEIEFEGDDQSFDRFTKFLTGDIQGFIGGLEPLNLERDDERNDDETHTLDEPGDNGPALASNGEIDPRALNERIQALGAKTDIERVTVMAQAAIDAGLDGLDSRTADKLYDELGIPKPSRWAKAFSNAKAKGLMRSAKYGVWRPTIAGENYAKHGLTPPVRRSPRRGSSGEGARLALELESRDPD
jgi:hypothetical protein